MGDVILATAGYDEKVVLWNPSTEVASRIIPIKEMHVNALAVTPDKQYLAVAAHKSLKVFDLHSNSPLPVHSYEGHSNNITAVGFPKKGNWLYTASEDGSLRIWDFATHRSQRCYKQELPANTAVLHPNQSELVAGYESGEIHQWDLTSERSQVIKTSEEEPIRSLQISGDARLGVAVNNSGAVYLWQCPEMQLLGRVQAHNTYATRCALSADASLLATSSADKTVKIWSVDTTSEYLLTLDKALIGHKMWVWDCAFTIDSAYMATTSTDGTAKLWEVRSGRIARNYIGVHTKGITSLLLNDYKSV